MNIVPLFANEVRDIVFYTRHGEALRPPKVLRKGSGSPSRSDAIRVGAKFLEVGAPAKTGCYSISCRI